jgi:TfoX/Sxy family transcriptional regulator of competence genes
MAFDEHLADRVRQVLRGEEGVTERRMFGGLAFMVDGHMACGVAGDELMLRLGADGAATALQKEHVRPMDFTGRPMKSMVFIDRTGLDGRQLDTWVAAAVAHARSLPPKG